MGKKSNNPNIERKQAKGKREQKDLGEKSRTAIINLHRRLHKCTFKRKAPTAVKQIKEAARFCMYTEDVRIDAVLNQHLWRNGVRNLDKRVSVVFERKKNEDEDAKQKYYTLVKLA
jgi:large subunit ribosomal protein L31e